MAFQIVAKQSVLLLLHLQVGTNKILPAASALIEHTASVVANARQKGFNIAHCRVAFDDKDCANLPTTNMTMSRLKEDASRFALFHVDAPTAAFDERLAPQGDDLVYRKTRVGPFLVPPSSAMHGDFKRRGIDTILIAGVNTSGAVLSAVMQAADLDYRLFVLEDCCADGDADVHKTLIEKVFPRQASVISSIVLEQI
jgi:nicotinamidase-related amidase